MNQLQVVYIKLGNFSTEQELSKEIEKYFKKKTNKREKRKILFLLDGYDEITFKDQTDPNK